MRPSSPQDLAHEVIESIIALTEQRDQHSLEMSLLRTLEEMLEGVETWLLCAPADTAGNRTVTHGDPRALPAAIAAAAERMTPSDEPAEQVDDGRHFLLAKLTAAEVGENHLLVMASTRWTQTDLYLVRGMIRVYRNFMALLFDSEKDRLTGLYNRRKLETKLEELVIARAQGRRSADRANADYLAFMDLDRFKQINDTHGHLIGDEVLLVFANILREVLRDTDLLFRYGGEEFIVLLQDTPRASIHEVLERLRQTVEDHVFPQVGDVTVSIGYTLVDGCQPPTRVIEEADRALYYAKEHGRNQTRSYPDLLARGALGPVGKPGSVELF